MKLQKTTLYIALCFPFVAQGIPTKEREATTNKNLVATLETVAANHLLIELNRPQGPINIGLHKGISTAIKHIVPQDQPMQPGQHGNFYNNDQIVHFHQPSLDEQKKIDEALQEVAPEKTGTNLVRILNDKNSHECQNIVHIHHVYIPYNILSDKKKLKAALAHQIDHYEHNDGHIVSSTVLATLVPGINAYRLLYTGDIFTLAGIILFAQSASQFTKSLGIITEDEELRAKNNAITIISNIGINPKTEATKFLAEKEKNSSKVASGSTPQPKEEVKTSSSWYSYITGSK